MLLFMMNYTNEKNGSALGVSVYAIVYARHGRELMGFKSPVSVPMLCNTA